ncbi:MAG: AAA family ATPase [Gammaproteobacteria bacterium]
MQGKEIIRSRLSLVDAGRADTAPERAAPQDATALSPFSPAVPDRYFETAALRECHARVARAALDSDTVAIVEGERGCGKTTFIRMLQQRVGPSRELCYIDVRIPQGERFVYDCLRRAFCADPAADMQALLAQLIERGRRDTACLIVVDNADRLSVFGLRLLFRLKRAVTEAGSRLGVVVTMSPLRLDAILTLPSFEPYRTGGLTRVELPHFSAQETADYLRARIESAGVADAISFDETQVQRIHRASGGLPQHIKRVAAELLEGNKPRRYRSTIRQQRIARLRHALIPVAAVVVPVIGIGLLLSAIFDDPTDDAVVAQLMSTAGIEATGTAVPLPDAPAATGAVDRTAEIRAAAPEKAEVAAAVKPAPPERKAPPAPPVAAPEPVAATPEPARETPRPAPEVKPAEALRAESAPEPAPAPVAAAPPVAVEPAPQDSNAWLRSQDPAYYTIQLAGADKREDVDEFIGRHALPGKAVVVEVLRNGKVWYMVLYNSYPTWGDARRELESLPPQVTRNNPFARSFASVQAIALAP